MLTIPSIEKTGEAPARSAPIDMRIRMPCVIAACECFKGCVPVAPVAKLPEKHHHLYSVVVHGHGP